MGSGGNFVPQLGPFASTLDSTRRKGTQTNQNIKKLGRLLIIVVEAHKRAALLAAMALAIIFFATLLRPAVGQTNFGGGSQNSNPSLDVNTRLFTGNQALDSGLVGIGLGALGATILAPAVGNALNGGGNSGFNNGFNNNGNSNNFNTGNYNQGNYNQGNYNRGSFNTGSFNSGGCQCDYSLTFQDQNWNTQGACRRTDNTGRTWCYTSGWSNNGCGDLQTSQRFPNNPWSYNACSYSG